MAKKKAVTLDTSEAVDFSKKREKVAPGTYRALVSNAEVTKSKKGNPMLVLEFTIRGNTRFKGEKLKRYGVLSGKGAGMTRDMLLAFHNESELVDGFEIDEDYYPGQHAVIVVEQDFYEHPEHTNPHREDGQFETRKVTEVYSADRGDVAQEVEDTEAATAPPDDDEEEAPF